MQLTELTFDGQPPVDSYGPGFFRVADHLHEGAITLMPDGVRAWGGLTDLQVLIDTKDDYDVVFIGMGADIAFLPKEISTQLEEAGVPFEVMGSPSACRTYNILLSEDRRVGLAVLPV